MGACMTLYMLPSTSRVSMEEEGSEVSVPSLLEESWRMEERDRLFRSTSVAGLNLYSCPEFSNLCELLTCEKTPEAMSVEPSSTAASGLRQQPFVTSHSTRSDPMKDCL